MIRVVLADDHPVVRAGLEQLLRTFSDLDVVAVVANGREAVKMAEALRPDVILMDLSMPILDGIGATREITELHPEIKVLMLTTFDDPTQINAALEAGAAGYLLKDVETAVLHASIRSVTTGGMPLSPMVAASLVRNRPITTQRPLLTRREEQIVRMIASGLSNRQISRDLGISEKTVKTHCGRLFQRLGVTDRTQAAVWATRHLDGLE